jgi:hypothetical protein
MGDEFFIPPETAHAMYWKCVKNMTRYIKEYNPDDDIL